MNDCTIGVQTITWGESLDDLESALRDISELGFDSFEVLNISSLVVDYERRTLQLGPVGPPASVTDTDYAVWLSRLMAGKREHGLAVSSIYTDAEFVNPALWPGERAGFEAVIAILRGLGAEYLVCGGGPPANGSPHAAEDYRAMASALEEIGRICVEYGLQLCYHPHLDTFVETAEQLDRLADASDPELVGLCLDPAHLVLKGDDPVAALERHVERVRYVHLKDVAHGDLTGLRGLERYEAFTELGEGRVDLVGMVDVLRRNDYSGPLVVELDYTKRTPRESAEISKRFLVETLGLSVSTHESQGGR
jgi:inosose dehydratase